MGLLNAGFIVHNLRKSYEPLSANQFGSLAPEINKLMKITNNDDENWPRDASDTDRDSAQISVM